MLGLLEKDNETHNKVSKCYREDMIIWDISVNYRPTHKQVGLIQSSVEKSRTVQNDMHCSILVNTCVEAQNKV